MPLGRYTFGIQWRIVLDRVPTPRRRGESNPPSQNNMQLQICQTVSPMLPPGEYKHRAGWTCHMIPPFVKLLCSLWLYYIISAVDLCLMVKAMQSSLWRGVNADNDGHVAPSSARRRCHVNRRHVIHCQHNQSINQSLVFESNTNRIGRYDSNSNRISNRIGRIYRLTCSTTEMCGTTDSSFQSSNTSNNTGVWSLVELASLYTVPLTAVNGLSRLTTTSNGQARPIRKFANRPITFESE